MKKYLLHLSLATSLGLPVGAIAQNVFPANGNVGIGTASPLYPLHVKGANGIIMVEGSQSAMQHKDSTGTLRFLTGLRNDVNPNLDYVFYSYGGDWNFVGGNVGIGTTDPGAGLDVQRTQTENFVRLSRAEAPAEYLNIRGVNEPSVGTGFSFQTRRWNGGGYDTQEAIYLGASGNVGIGTTSPQAKVHIAGGDAIVDGAITSKSPSPSHFGALELGFYNGPGQVSGIDFHHPSFPGQDFNVRMINDANNVLNIGSVTGPVSFNVGGKVSATTIDVTSDKFQKAGFAAVAERNILDKLTGLSVMTWHYTNSPVPHIGVMAQDFYRAFHVGEDDKHISVVDGLGVAFGAIQGLNAKVEDALKSKDAEITELKAQNASLQRQVAEVTKQVTGIQAIVSAIAEAMPGNGVQQASFRPAATR